MRSLDSLPDEVILEIIKMAASPGWDWRFEYDHDFLVDVISKVSLRFRRLATG